MPITQISPVLRELHRTKELSEERFKTDASLMEEYVEKRSTDAFDALMRRHSVMVMGVCRRVLRHEADAEDAFQATFLVLVHKAAGLFPRSHVGNWLHGVAFNIARKFRAMKKVRTVKEALRPVPTSSATDEVDQEHLRAILDEELLQLPEQYRLVLVLCDLEGRTLKEASRQLGSPQGTIASRLSRGRSLLSERLRRRGLGISSALCAGALAQSVSAIHVPSMLFHSTSRAARLLTQGEAITHGLVSSQTQVVVDRVVRTMLLSKLKFILPLVAMLGLSAYGVLASLTPNVSAQDVAKENNSPTTPITNRSGASIVEQARQHDAWFKDVKSFYARMEAVQKRSLEAIENAKKRILARNPEEKLDPNRFSELRPEVHEVSELAFDGNHVRDFHEIFDYSLMTRAWDGEKVIGHAAFPHNKQSNYWLRRDAKETFWMTELDQWGWQKADYLPQWFMPERGKSPMASSKRGESKEYEVVGREQYKGIPCIVLSRTKEKFERWYVGEKTGFIHRVQELPLNGGNPEADAVAREIARQHSASIDHVLAFEQWADKLPAKEKEAVLEELLKCTHARIVPGVEYWCLDYQEVSPGRWFPMRHGMTSYEAENSKPVVRIEKRWKVTKLSIDKPLSSDLFQLAIPEGADVADGRFTPEVRYRYKSKQTPTELQSIVEQQTAARAKQDEQLKIRKERMDALVGKPAWQFPKQGTWINSTPLEWKQFQGKVVILDFWAIWCAPCLNDLPRMRQAFEQQAQSGIVVIGVHTTHDELEEVRTFTQRQKLLYPIFVDVPVKNADGIEGWGEMYRLYQTQSIPQSFLIDQAGNIAGYGTFSEMLLKAKELKTRAVIPK